MVISASGRGVAASPGHVPRSSSVRALGSRAAPDDGRQDRLERELARLLARHRPGTGLVALRREMVPRRSSWSIEDLRLHLSDGSVVHLLWKDLGREAPESRAHAIKPREVLERRRELWMYSAVLAEIGEGPVCWGSVDDGPRGIHWLFLEPVRGSPLCELGGADAWIAAAAWLGRFHARFSGLPPRGSLLLRHGPRLHRWWYRRALEFAERAARRGGTGSSRTRREADLLGELEPLHRVAVDRVSSMRSTLLHGEFCPANVLVTGGEAGRRIVPVDWEMAGVGPPVLDLAALTSGGWQGRDRSAFATAYREARLEAGADCPPLERLLELLDAALLLLAVQWMGWTGEAWSPPVELSTDWMQEAVRSASRMRT